ncbi:MAG: histidine--tRNA ligase [Eubacteriales bacterium]|nr:histidine--tRNA ligase [Bacillota bacterium]MBV1727448.1 histidine--tRNA ligase [Desulforudis sp.]MDP3051485.1 histidine--tRNA ligase [Eubacteriales bacterium]MDQ7788807.1 histidine--tRNA ligase [Clostridia bacterium]MBU4532922.1 histidine--tRNA ligase [Bacillota bacterium]
MQISRVRGTSDILPGTTEKWQAMEQTMHQICREYAYREIRTPIFEHTELFLRGVGETTDIVEKEMYTFLDKGGRSITLRPEGTAAIARAYLENKMFAQPQPIKLYCAGPMFRYDRPQAGRLRQFHQFDVEVIGAEGPGADAEIIVLAMDFLARLGLKNLQLHINSVGCPQCRQVLPEKLRTYFSGEVGDLCGDCRTRIDRNPLRVLDCKNGKCRDIGREAPTPLDCLCTACTEHFEQVRRQLDILGIECVVNPRLVRGLDYYTRTAFEILFTESGAQNAVGGGGRYDGLMETIGGASVPAVGFAIGLERVLLLLDRQDVSLDTSVGLEAFVAVAGDTEQLATRILADLRKEGLAADRDYAGRSLKAQMKYAGKTQVPLVVITGEDEAARGVAVVRMMTTGEQTEVPIEMVAERVRTLSGR